MAREPVVARANRPSLPFASIRRRLGEQSNFLKVASNTFWLCADRLLRMGMGLVVGVWVTRYLGPEQFGLLSFAGAFVALFTPLTTLGLENVAVRDIVRNRADKDEILGTVITLRLLGALFAIPVLICVNRVLTHDSIFHLLVTILACGFFFQPFDSIDFWFQAQIKSQFSVLAKSSAFLIGTALRVLMIEFRFSLVAFAWASLVEFLSSAIGMLIAYRASGSVYKNWRLSVERASSLLRDSWPLIIAGVAVMTYMRIDQVMLGQMSGKEAVGVYSAAIRLSEAWYFIPMAIVTSLTPGTIEARGRGLVVYHEYLQRLFSLMVVLALVVAVPISFFSGQIIRLLYGNLFSDAAPILAVHVWTGVFVFLGVAQGPWDVNERLTLLSLRRVVIGAVANIVLNLILIPRYSGLGAALSTVFSQALASCFLNVVDHRTRRIFVMQARAIVLGVFFLAYPRQEMTHRFFTWRDRQ